MRDQFKNYDKWKLASPDDQADEQQRRRLREERQIDRADEIRDRDKDAKNSFPKNFRGPK